jgi:hypothetical protein
MSPLGEDRRPAKITMVEVQLAGRLVRRWIPKVQILHPYPNERFYAKHPK